VLSDAQIAVLSGEPAPPPNTCTCAGCLAVIDTSRATHVCSRCTPRLAVAVHGGGLAVTLAGKPLQVLSVQETRAVVAQLAHLITPAPAIRPEAS
jgi:hypothetical protein